MDMLLSQLEVLIAIVDTGSLTEAGEAVGLTQSAVSYSLSKLEAELGVTLLERGRQGIAVTRIGDDVLQHARNIVSQIDIIRQKTARERGIAVGKVRFGCVSQVPARFLTGIIRNFQRQYPGIQVVLFQGSSSEIVEWLDHHTIDVGTVVDPAPYPISTPLVENEIHAVLPQEHRLAEQATISINDLIGEPFIGFKREISRLTALLRVTEKSKLDIRYQVNETSTIYAMIREGMGFSILPSMLIDADTEGITSRPLHPTLMMQSYLAARVDSPAANAFLRLANHWTKTHGFLPNNI
ncbi:MAG: LysR family transcriptional regulator [Chloroflexales bacterium]|nr:LysR family transcriptional regulator [Chloroflexales bacterium]